jgi:metallo-beta-lactamase class B
MRTAWSLSLLLLALPALAMEPFRVVANIYSVGASDATVFLVGTPKGMVLINSGAPSEYDQIRANIKKLGFDYYDIRILLSSHAHYDHAGNFARIRLETGARLMAADGDVPLLERGGKDDPQFGDKFPFPPVDVDQPIHDGDRVAIGGIIFTAHLTPGHTKGCTTWTTTVRWQKKPYDVVFVGSASVPSEYRLVGNPKYPDEVADYKHTFEVLRSIHPDVFLGSHGSFFDLEGKYARRNGPTNPFVDPEGYRKHVAEMEKAFNQRLSAAGPARPS